MVVHREENIKAILFKMVDEKGLPHNNLHFPSLAHNFGWEEFDASAWCVGREEDLDAQRDDAEYFLWENLGKSVEDPGYFTEDSTWVEDHIHLDSHCVSCCLGIAFGYVIGQYDEDNPSIDIVKRLQVLESSFMPHSSDYSVGRFIDIISKLRQDIHSNLG